MFDEMLQTQSSYIHFNMSMLIINIQDDAFIGKQNKEIPFQFVVDSDSRDQNQANNRAAVKIPINYEVGAKVQGYVMSI